MGATMKAIKKIIIACSICILLGSGIVIASCEAGCRNDYNCIYSVSGRTSSGCLSKKCAVYDGSGHYCTCK